tara:strand:- start:4512 stop:4739 length:228 start_codon:yes stop_codon:yes gene_type:complete
MTAKEVKVKSKWEKSFYPFFKIDCLKISGFFIQYIFTLNLFFNLLWIELNISNELIIFKVGIFNMYIMLGGGSYE